MNQKNSILITGSTGFIGSNLINGLNSKEFLIKKAIRKNLASAGAFVIEDINSKTDWSDPLIRTDTVIHLAALAHSKTNSSLHSFLETNCNGTVNLAKQAADKGVKRFIFLSSIGVNGGNTKGVPFTESTGLEPNADYAKSKYRAEMELKKIANSTQMEVVIIRPPLVYGRNAPGNFEVLLNLIDRVKILPFGCINNRRDFISIGNLCDFISLCITHPKAANETFVISDGETISTKEFTNAIARGCGKKLYQFKVPVILFKFAGAILGKSKLIDQLVLDLEVDSNKARDLLGWVPKEKLTDAMSHLKDN